MARKIIVSIEADIELEATEKEEELIKKINEASLNVDDDYETYDKLENKLANLIMERVEKEISEVTILDIDWD